jgi:hypothetical protein
MERKSEQEWTTTVKNTEAINVKASRGNPRFDMSVSSQRENNVNAK